MPQTEPPSAAARRRGGEKRRRRKKRTVSGVIITIVTWLVIALGAAAVAAALLGVRLYVVETGSMEPALPVGCVCFVNQRPDYDSVQVGDIIVFRRTDQLRVIHRVIAVTDAGLETQGDANNLPDGVPITRSMLVGTYLFHIPRMGGFITWIQTLQGKIMVVAFACVLIALSLMLNEKEKHDEKNEVT